MSMRTDQLNTPAPKIAYLSGEAQPLKLAPDDRRFMVVLATDEPVLRNDLWSSVRSIPHGRWTVAVHDATTGGVLAMKDYVVDDFGALAALSPAAAQASRDWYCSLYTIDQAACEWMDQFSAPVRPGSALHAMHQAAQASKPDDDVQAIRLPEPYYPGHAATLLVQDDPHWRSRDPLYSVLLEHDEDRLVLTRRQVRALVAGLTALLLTACGGGDPEDGPPDVPTPAVVCPVSAPGCTR